MVELGSIIKLNIYGVLIYCHVILSHIRLNPLLHMPPSLTDFVPEIYLPVNEHLLCLSQVSNIHWSVIYPICIL